MATKKTPPPAKKMNDLERLALYSRVLLMRNIQNELAQSTEKESSGKPISTLDHIWYLSEVVAMRNKRANS